MQNALAQLKEMTVVVADTGDEDQVAAFQPQDCTTNPSLVLAALDSPKAQALIAEEIAQAKARGADTQALCATLTVALGARLAQKIPGRISTEVDACLSFDTEGSLQRARQIIEDYEARGVSKHRVLIKLAATWEGIQAAAVLEKEGINCNLTLLFCLDQAKACADAGVFLISPFVGRITDWFKATQGVAGFDPEEDPGVLSVREIYRHYKSHGVQTIVMGASFRSTAQIKALAGCDRLTIAPKLLHELREDQSKLVRCLSPGTAITVAGPLSQGAFRWGLNTNAMATEKLAEGIRAFDLDHRKLLSLLQKRFSG